MPDDVPLSVKKARLSEAQSIAMKHIETENKHLVGSRVEVLVESLDKKGKFYSGRTRHNKCAHIVDAAATDIGKIIDVVVTDANVSNLKGRSIRCIQGCSTRALAQSSTAPF
jgi:tRNA-2-methylthio-N6-dimethylallyladenosine synthase